MSELTEVCDRPMSLQRAKHQICLRDLSNQREMKIQDSPTIKLQTLSQSTSTSPLVLDIPPTASGTCSPPNRRCKDFPSVATSSVEDASSEIISPQQQQQEQLPLAGSVRQLSKLKRFLTTLQQFASDISPEIGERVHALVLALINSHISVEDFHCKLQEATNFPLRPFVVPFLKANLPYLQRELMQISPSQTFLAFPSSLFSTSVHSYLFQPSPKDLISPEINSNGKRPQPERTKENSYNCPPPAKRPHNLSPVGLQRLNSYTNTRRPHVTAVPLIDNLRLTQDVFDRQQFERKSELNDVDQDCPKHLDSYGFNSSRDHQIPHNHSENEDWQFVENMLNNIIVMVDRCKRILESLEERNCRWRKETGSVSLLQMHQKLIDAEYRRCPPTNAASNPAFAGHRADDQLSQVHRRTEEAIHDVRMQAVLELQQAVAAAEVKANHIVAAERAKMELAILEARKQAQEEILAALGRQEKSTETCWNCGRKANETCSGCHMARYCGSYCQHKDWETHHRICGSKAQQTAAFSESQDVLDNSIANPSDSKDTRPYSRETSCNVSADLVDITELENNPPDPIENSHVKAELKQHLSD